MSLSEKPSLCTMSTLAQHIFRTEKLPSCTKLFISSGRPHKMMVSTTVERWIKSFPSSSGMDTAVFNVRSVRGVSVTNASDIEGVPVADIAHC